METETPGYKNYLEARDAAFKMLEAGSRAGAKASAYYEDEMRGLEYMLDASPLIVKNLRHHCHHITGIKECICLKVTNVNEGKILVRKVRYLYLNNSNVVN